MRISGFTTVRPEPHGTRTYEDFSRFLGRLSAQVKSCELLEPLQDSHIRNAAFRGISSQAKG